MKIKHFVVTYNNNAMLRTAIDCIYATSTEHERSVHVICNHSNDSYDGPHPVQLLRNELRPDFSTGHLARNWNQAIMLGFRDLTNPDADLLILSQNDCLFETGYLDACLELHKQYDLVTYGAGDNCVSYTPKAVLRVGLWDERFCNIGFQEADYFLRAGIYLRERASINDRGVHRREYNPISNVGEILRRQKTGFARRDEAHLASMKYHNQSFRFFQEKWSIRPDRWGPEFYKAEQKLPNFIFYPYFEKHVETLKEQKYLEFFATE